VKIEGGECSALKEEVVDVGNAPAFRMALKSECDKPVTYAVAMNTDDWVVNMEHAYADFDLVQCKPAPDEQDVVECMIRVTPEKPVTGW